MRCDFEKKTSEDSFSCVLIIITETGCDMSISTQIIHMLGVPHEHQRPDRDDYLDIDWDLIQPLFHWQFKKYDAMLPVWRGVPYDYNSVMHYDARAFARLPLKSMQTIIPKVDLPEPIGQRRRLSDIDKRKLQAMYPCRPHIRAADQNPESDTATATVTRTVVSRTTVTSTEWSSRHVTVTMSAVPTTFTKIKWNTDYQIRTYTECKLFF